MRYNFLVLITLIALFALSLTEAAVIAIDYGTDWFKVALVKPGIPLDIVLNRDSKRKTQSALTIRGEERIYGSDAVNLGARFPLNTYFSIKKVLGRLVDDKTIKDYQSVFPNKIIPDPIRGTVVFQHNETTVFTVEELLAMQFTHAKELAEVTAQETIKDVVITVPSYYNQFERQAILDAADLAGLHVLSLVNDVTAVGLNYAISHYTSFTEEPQYHVFYDMGAGSTKASLISFKTSNVKDVGRFNKTIINLDVLSVGYDRSLGGQEFDIRLQRHFAEEFDKKFSGKLKSSIFTSERAMTKLYKEANRIKQILSANTDAIASIENLHEEHDFRLAVTRSELEKMTSDLRNRVGGPIKTALNNAKLTLAGIRSCVLVGGGVRVPSILAELKDIIGEDKIAQNVNGDEAAVLGAAFRGAGLSRQFKVKEIKVKDITPYSIEVNHSSEPKESEDGTLKSKEYHTVLFNQFTAVGTRKIMSFPRISDFNFSLNYAILDEATKDFGSANIAIAKITGLTAAIKQFNDDGVDRPKVKVTLQLSESGIVSATDAIATIEQQSFTDKFKSFFGVNGNKSEESIKEVPLPDEIPSSSVNASEPTSEANATQTNVNESVQKQTKIETINLNLEVEYVGIKPLGVNEKEESIKRLLAMDASDRQRRAREEARNSLEAFVYHAQDFLQNEVVLQVSTDSQRAELLSKLSETSDWLYGEGEEAQTAEFRMRLNNLKLLEQPIAYRREERIKLPDAIFTIKTAINSTRAFVDGIKTNTTADRYHTDEELDKLLSVCGKVEEWLNEKLEIQEKTSPHVDPILITSDINKKLNEIEQQFLILVSKKSPRKPKATTKTTEDTKATMADEQSTSKGSTTESVDQPTTTTMTFESKETGEPTTSAKEKHDEL
ncbi:Hsp70 protein [Glomus cerebriforme]|uniref:Hsp70 protein n=1 Tax=Glomus cerebriforme TaxID=658196 RepID=A0A397SZL6_9GLOM|nr:Hsp70 protein [Glomus cerebriforme]